MFLECNFEAKKSFFLELKCAYFCDAGFYFLAKQWLASHELGAKCQYLNECVFDLNRGGLFAHNKAIFNGTYLFWVLFCLKLTTCTVQSCNTWLLQGQ
jgi:hypothetical protein